MLSLVKKNTKKQKYNKKFLIVQTRNMQRKLHMIGILLLVIGGLNWGLLALTGKDLVSEVFGKKALLTNIIFVLVGLAALGIGMYRDSYLPFLGETVFPCSLLTPQTPDGADMAVTIQIQPGTKVLYWAAEPESNDLKTLQNWRNAYLGFKNAGVAVADEDGTVTLKARKPQPYTVPMKGELSPHIHYRVCGDNGFLGRVMTVDLEGKEYFSNYVSQESNPESVPVGTEMEVMQPEHALDDVNMEAIVTAKENAMTQTGGIEESPQPAGASLEDAYGGL
jgi:uncharacterized membrane protein YuzA (DUF378 family)